MKAKRMMAAVENRKGDFWQIALTEPEMAVVLGVIGQLHGGHIKVLRNKMPLYFVPRKKP